MWGHVHSRLVFCLEECFIWNPVFVRNLFLTENMLTAKWINLTDVYSSSYSGHNSCPVLYFFILWILCSKRKSGFWGIASPSYPSLVSDWESLNFEELNLFKTKNKPTKNTTITKDNLKNYDNLIEAIRIWDNNFKIVRENNCEPLVT